MLLARPTLRGKLLLAIFVATLCTTFVNANLTTCLASAFLGGLMFSSFFLAFFSLYGITLQRLDSQDGTRGSHVLMPVTVNNKGRRVRQAVVIQEECLFTREKTYSVTVPPLAPPGNTSGRTCTGRGPARNLQAGQDSPHRWGPRRLFRPGKDVSLSG